MLVLLLLLSAGCARSHDLQSFVNLSRAVAERFETSCMVLFRSDRQTQIEAHRTHVLAKLLSRSTSLLIRPVVPYVKYVKEYEKRACARTIHLVYGVDLKIQASLKKLSRLHPVANSVWFVFLNSSIANFFKEIHLSFDIQLIAGKIADQETVELFEVYRVDKGFPTRVKVFGKWTAESGLNAVKGLLYSRRSDLEGKVLRTGSAENWPLSSFHGKLDPRHSWDGMYCRVWRELEKLMNFTSVHLRTSSGAGIQNKNGTWNGLVGMILRGEIDVIVSELNMTPERLDALDFTQPMLRSWYNIFLRQPGYSIQWFAVFGAFDRSVWMAILVWIISATICLSVCRFAFPPEVSWSPKEAFFFILQALCQQGCPNVPEFALGRFLFFLSYLVSAVLVPSYSASLVSSLTYHTPSRPFDSLKEMLSDGRYKLYVEENTAEYSYFANSTENTAKMIYEKLIKTIPGGSIKNSSTGIEKLCKEQYVALFGIQEVIEARVAERRSSDCKVISLTKPLRMVHEALALAKGNQFTDVINYHLHKMVESGVIQQIKRQVWPRHEVIPETWVQVQLVQIFQVFVILLAGISLSNLFLLMEKCHFKLHSSRKS